MATLTQTTRNMVDKFKDTTGDVIELLNQTAQDNMTDWHWMECNQGTKHQHSIRSGLPDTHWGALYEGIPHSKGEKQQVQDTTGFVEQMAQVDTRELDLQTGSDEKLMLRAAEAEPYIESMSQELMSAFFYHNPATNARYPKGLGARFGAKATSGVGNQIIDAGGTGSDNTSIWMVTHGYDGVCALYPKGTQGGITQEDKGEQRVLDASGNAYYVKEELFRAYCGFAVKDYRKVVRVANLDISDVRAGSVDIYDWLRKAYWQCHNRRAYKVGDPGNRGHTAIYCNKDILEALDGLATNSGSSDNFTRLRPMEIEGREILTYRGMPLRETDALLNTEARIV